MRTNTLGNMKRASEYYLIGIQEGRAYFRAQGGEDAAAHIKYCDTTIARHPRGSMLSELARGERDFWMAHLDNAAP